MPDDPQVQQPPSRWPIAVAVICVGLIILAGYIFKSCADKPALIADGLGKAIQPQISIRTVIQTSLERLREESKLVVYTADVAVMAMACRILGNAWPSWAVNAGSKA